MHLCVRVYNWNLHFTHIPLWPNFTKKLPLWQSRVASKIFSDFPLLHDLMTEYLSIIYFYYRECSECDKFKLKHLHEKFYMKNCRSNFQIQLIPVIEEHLKMLQENFEKYFTAEQNATLDANSYTLHPFT